MNIIAQLSSAPRRRAATAGRQIRAQSAGRTALKIISTPQDVANLVLFLASDLSRTITGQSITVDAGYTMT
jgi:enoyl-[acyl-carrier-protein] reductase (NADH)